MKLFSLGLVGSLLFVGGCVPTFDNVVKPTSKETVDLDPYVGVWKLTKMFGKTRKETDEQVFLSAQKQGEQLKVILAPSRDFSKPKRSDIMWFQLLHMGKHTIAFENENGRDWTLGRFAFKGNGKQLSIEGLNQTKLMKDIQCGTLKGEVHGEQIRQTWIHVTASAKDVRTYLTERAEFGEAFVLTKIR